MTLLMYFSIYIVIGICVCWIVKPILDNVINKNLCLKYLDCSKAVQYCYIIFNYVIVTLLWPLFLIALMIDELYEL